MASTLYENVEDWHPSGESRDLISSGETESLSFKGDVEDHDDGFEEISPKQHSVLEITEKESHAENETRKENGHDYNGINGNGVHEEHGEDECNGGEDGDGNGNDEDDIVEDLYSGEENDSDRASAETNEDEPAPPVPYYGRTLVAPEYMNFQLPEETSEREEKDTEDKDDDEIAVADESDDLSPSENNQVEEKQDEEQRAEEEASGQTVQKEVLEEDDITLSEEESDEDEDGDVVEQDERVRDDCQVEEEKKEEEEEDLDDEGDEEEEEEEEAQEESKEEAEDDEEQTEDDELEENEDNGIREENLLKEDKEVEEKESNEEDMQHAAQNGTCFQLGKADDDDDDHDELISEDMTVTKEAILVHSDSLKVNVASPTRDISEVASAPESFDDGEGVTTEDDDVDKVEQEETVTAREQSSNETDEEDEETRKTFNGPVEEYESQPKKDEEGDEMGKEDESCQSDDSEEDGGDDNAAPTICVSDQEEAKEEHTCDDDEADGSVDLETIPEGEDAESDREAQGEDEYSVHINLQGHDDDSDLSGRVKELGRMFEGGGPVFPKTAKTDDTDAVDGCPVSVRRYKAIFEQDKMSAARAREPGRREELTGPPRGIVKNLRGMFENPQGFEAKKG